MRAVEYLIDQHRSPLAIERNGIGIVSFSEHVSFGYSAHFFNGPVPCHDLLVLIDHEGGVRKEFDNIQHLLVGCLQGLFNFRALGNLLLKLLIGFFQADRLLFELSRTLSSSNSTRLRSSSAASSSATRERAEASSPVSCAMIRSLSSIAASPYGRCEKRLLIVLAFGFPDQGKTDEAVEFFELHHVVAKACGSAVLEDFLHHCQ